MRLALIFQYVEIFPGLQRIQGIKAYIPTVVRPVTGGKGAKDSGHLSLLNQIIAL